MFTLIVFFKTFCEMVSSWQKPCWTVVRKRDNTTRLLAKFKFPVFIGSIYYWRIFCAEYKKLLYYYKKAGLCQEPAFLWQSSYFTSTVNLGILPLNLDLASAPTLSTTGVARSMPTSAVSSAEKIPGWVRSILPSPTFLSSK